MLRRLQTFIVWMVWMVALPAAAQQATAETPDQESPSGAIVPDQTVPESAPVEPPASENTSEPSSPPPPAADAQVGTGLAASATVPTPAAAEAPAVPKKGNTAEAGDWSVFASGYFRAPLAMGLSTRTGPDDKLGNPDLQVSYGPNRTVDANYYSFAYTRLQEQDWAELFIHAKMKHAEAVVGWMGYWFQAASFRNLDAGWLPGMAYLTLDTDFDIAGLRPNIALIAGAFWPSFGYSSKYDTFTLGRFRHIGEQLRLTIPMGGFTATLFQGFGSGRDGSFNVGAPPPYQAKVGLNLLHYEHLQLAYKDYVQIGLHYNTQWTRDPNLFQTTTPGKAFTDAKEARISTVGGELKLSAPVAGTAWVSPSYVTVRNGWALGEAGTEVMHSLSAEGIAVNYLGWSGSLSDSTGSGKMFNLGFLYENSLRNILGANSQVPELKLNVFGLFTDISLDLPVTSTLTQDHIGQFKYGADLELQPVDWLGVMVRWDEVNYNIDHAGYLFNAITARLTFSTHFLSGESIYLQYSRYRYGDAMRLAGTWPWGTPLVAGSDIFQGGPYSGQTPDMDVLKLQASVAF